MRVRVTVLVAALMACACAVTPSIAAAHGPIRDRALTIHNSPQSIVAGDPVLIYGRLLGRESAHQRIVLWHRLNPRAGFTIIGRTQTDSSGRYEFTRQNGIVQTNRSWYVTGPVRSHSQTVHEQVSAEVTLTPSATQATTRHPITFTGQVSPGHAGQTIELQAQRGDSNNWNTIKTARLDSSSSYSIPFAWRFPGPRNVRAVFPGDPRNTRGISAVSSVVVEQAEVPDFTIQSSNPIVPNQTPVTISGTLRRHRAARREAGVSVALYTSQPRQHSWSETQTTTTGPDGSYSLHGAGLDQRAVPGPDHVRPRTPFGGRLPRCPGRRLDHGQRDRRCRRSAGDLQRQCVTRQARRCSCTWSVWARTATGTSSRVPRSITRLTTRSAGRSEPPAPSRFASRCWATRRT